MSATSSTLAPDLAVSEWFNTSTPLTLAALRGRPVFIHSFQLLCPGCVSEAIPQVHRIARIFGHTDLQIIGLHTVFEHHAAMTPVTLKAFLLEYGIEHPVAVDLTDDCSDIPITMRRFGFRGTPSSILVGRDGSILHQAFGVDDDLSIGAKIALALATKSQMDSATMVMTAETGSRDGTCKAPTLTRGAG